MRELAEFIKYLVKNGLVEFNILGISDEAVDNQIKIQKYVFFAQSFGLKLGFEYDIYMSGPHSSLLSEKYHEIAENRKKLYEPIDPSIPESFETEEFLRLVKGRNMHWLTVAAMLVDGAPTASDKWDLVEMVEWCTLGITHKQISDVCSTLEYAGIVRYAECPAGTGTGTPDEEKNAGATDAIEIELRELLSFLKAGTSVLENLKRTKEAEDEEPEYMRRMEADGLEYVKEGMESSIKRISKVQERQRL